MYTQSQIDRADPAAATTDRWMATLHADGYVVVPDAVPQAAVRAALRRLNLAIRHHGLRPEEIEACQQTTFFPHLRWEAEVWGALPEAAARVLGWQEGDEWAEPQLLLRFPDAEQDWPMRPHVDEPPPWAGGRPYRGIAGVALTTAGPEDGAPCVWPRSHRGASAGPVTVALRAGDALLMHPQLAHGGTLNLGPSMRAAVYFRLLAGSGAAAASSSSTESTPAAGV